MSNKMRPAQWDDPKGTIIDSHIPNLGIFAEGSGVPANSVGGYQKGCLYINRAGSIGSLLYINSGTTASSTWTNII